MRERIERQAEQRRGFRMLPDGFGCIRCEHVESAPRQSSYDATDEQEAARRAAVDAAVSAIRAHVAECRSEGAADSVGRPQ